MAAYLITGPSGSGKTSVGIELLRRGYNVIETDSRFGYLANRKTEAPVDYPGVKNITPEWYKVNGWIWNRQIIEKSLNNCKKKIVFYCGAADNEHLFYHRFDRVFFLNVAPKTLIERLTDRKERYNNPTFIELSLKELKRYERKAKLYNMVMIRSDQCSVKDSTNAILTHIEENLMSIVARLINYLTKHRILKRRIIKIASFLRMKTN